MRKTLFIIILCCTLLNLINVNQTEAQVKTNTLDFLLPSGSSFTVTGALNNTVLETGEYFIVFILELSNKISNTYNFYGITIQFIIENHFEESLFFSPMRFESQILSKTTNFTYDTSWGRQDVDIRLSCTENFTTFPNEDYNSGWGTIFTITSSTIVGSFYGLSPLQKSIIILLGSIFGIILMIFGWIKLKPRLKFKFRKNKPRKRLEPLPSETRPCSYCGEKVLKKIKVCPNCLKVIE